MKILITGGSGFLGSRLIQDLSKIQENTQTPQREVIGTYLQNPHEELLQMDITDHDETMMTILGEMPDMIIHTAAAIDVNWCEKHEYDAYRINVDGTRNVALAARATGAHLIKISTGYVHDGPVGNYPEARIPDPRTVYGETKRLAERVIPYVLDGRGTWNILRFDRLYGFNPLKEPGLMRAIREGQEITVYPTQERQPLFVNDVAHVIESLQETGKNGVVHLGGPERMTMGQLVEGIASLYGREIKIENAGLDTSSIRPDHVTLDTSLAASLGIQFTPFQKALKIMRHEMIKAGKLPEGQRRGIER
ncbi:SDR family oxidoreductase [Candidatus Roizmanbacteria bacterium]|nr:SDR family oxidoreductase [Candidatus Roizmanbacteria bacterium]